MDLADVRLTDLVRGIRSYKDGDAHYRDAQEHGAFEGSFVHEELRKRVLQPVLDELLAEQANGNPGLDQNLNSLSRMGYALWKAIKRADEAMVDFYQVEDEIFRMATYMRRLSMGDDAPTAARIAREQFLDYDIRAPWINAARRSVLPFISYTYRAVPVIAKSIAERPWKLAKYATLAHLANALAYELAPGDEEEERRTMREEAQGYTWIGIPRMLRMPWRDAHGNPVFQDIRRFIPGGDVFDMHQGQSALPIPAPLQFGGPVMLAFEFLLNKQAFTGKEIINPETDTLGDKVAKVTSWAYKSYMPSAAYIPGSWYWDKMATAISGGRDFVGRPYSVAQAFWSSIGVKIQPHDVQQGYYFRASDLAQAQRELKYEARRASYDYARNIMGAEDYREKVAEIREKMRRVQEKAEALRGD